jgi:hypothetical protein
MTAAGCLNYSSQVGQARDAHPLTPADLDRLRGDRWLAVSGWSIVVESSLAVRRFETLDVSRPGGGPGAVSR